MIHNTFLSAKSFDIEDDLQFCPAVLDSLPTPPATHPQATPSTITSTSTSTPTAVAVGVGAAAAAATTATTPLAVTPRIKKALDIINPHTGLRVASPKH